MCIQIGINHEILLISTKINKFSLLVYPVINNGKCQLHFSIISNHYLMHIEDDINTFKPSSFSVYWISSNSNESECKSCHRKHELEYTSGISMREESLSIPSQSFTWKNRTSCFISRCIFLKILANTLHGSQMRDRSISCNLSFWRYM